MVRNLHGIVAVKTCLTDRKVAHHVLKLADLHISQRISSDAPADFLCGILRSNQLLVGRHVNTEIAGMKKWR